MMCESVKRDEAYRYLSQININQAQIMVGANKLREAETLLMKNLKIVKKFAHDYVAEALAALTYIYYLEQKYDLAISNGEKAIIEFNRLGFYESEDAVKQILVAALYKLNRIRDAKKVWEEIKNKVA